MEEKIKMNEMASGLGCEDGKEMASSLRCEDGKEPASALRPQHGGDVAEAERRGELRGRNAVIRMRLDELTAGDGLPDLSGSGAGPQHRRPVSIFDLAAQA